MNSFPHWLCGVLALLASSCLTSVNEIPLGSVDAGLTGGGTAMTGGGATGGGGGTTGGGTATGGGNTGSNSVSCSSDGFCWERAPYGGTFHGVAGLGPNFVMAVGEGGVVARYDGTTWTYLRTSPGKTLRSVWFETETRGWAVGESGTILEWDGTTWSPIASPTTRDLLAIHGKGDVVYVGGVEVVLKRSNGAFELVPNVLPVTDSECVARRVSVVSANEVYVAGTSANFLRRFDGTQWVELLESSSGSGGPSTSDALYGLDTCEGNLFVSGSYSGEANAAWVRVNGSWGNVTWPGSGRIVCLGGNEFLSFGPSYYDDQRVMHLTLGATTTVEEVGTGFDLRAAWAASARDVWLVGTNGSLVHWTGATLASTLSERTRLVVASSANNVWAVRQDDVVEHFDGTSWTRLQLPNGTGSVSDIFGASANEVWVVRGSQVLFLKDNTWNFVDAVPAGTMHLRGTSASNVWLSGGAGAVVQYDGTRLVTHFLGSGDTTGPMHVTATQTWVPTWSQNGTVRSYRRTSSGWQEAPRAWRIGGFGDEVYLSDVASLLRWTGGQMTSLVSDSMSASLLAGTSDALLAVKTSYTAEGNRSQVVRVQNAVVTPLVSGTSERLTSLSATLDGHIWATTEGGAVLHRKP